MARQQVTGNVGLYFAAYRPIEDGLERYADCHPPSCSVLSRMRLNDTESNESGSF
jgi:hypothetical protein